MALLLPSLPAVEGFRSVIEPTSLPEVRNPLIYHPSSLSSPGAPPFVPSDIRRAYNFLPLYSKGIGGNGTRIAIIDAYGDPVLADDLSNFDSLAGLPPTSVNIFYPDGPPAVTDPNWALETALDVEWAHAIAPSATIDLVVALDPRFGSIFNAIGYVTNSLVNETVLSMSFGATESSYPTTGSFTIAAMHQLFVTMTSHGTTPFASSGDVGAFSCCNVQYPASDPLVVAVGGTSLTLNPDASYRSETTWFGSSAGASTIFPKPTWQLGLGSPMRNIVDVSYNGDPNTGFLVVQGGQQFQVGGTSAGAPQWAALIDLASQANSQSYGPINSKLYRLSSYHDITSGSDSFFKAGPSWDFPTGLGTPNATAIVRALAPTIPISLNNTAVFGGITVTTTGSLQIRPANATLSGTTTVVARNSTTGVVLFNKTYTALYLSLQSLEGALRVSFLLSIEVKPYPLSWNIRITESGGSGSASFEISRRVDANGDGKVDLLDLVIVALAFGSTANGPGYDGRGDLDGNGTVNIIDLVLITKYFGALDFI